MEGEITLNNNVSLGKLIIIIMHTFSFACLKKNVKQKKGYSERGINYEIIPPKEYLSLNRRVNANYGCILCTVLTGHFILSRL